MKNKKTAFDKAVEKGFGMSLPKPQSVSEHTPTPSDIELAIAQLKDIIKHSYFNAVPIEYIVRAVNVHEDLLKALKVALELEENTLIDFDKYGFETNADIAEMYRRAVAKAEGK